MPNVRNVLLISMIFIFTFGVIAVNLLKGRYYECKFVNISSSKSDADYLKDYGITIKDKYDCYNYGGEWLKNDTNFDNIGSAMLALF